MLSRDFGGLFEALQSLQQVSRCSGLHGSVSMLSGCHGVAFDLGKPVRCLSPARRFIASSRLGGQGRLTASQSGQIQLLRSERGRPTTSCPCRLGRFRSLP